MKGNPRDQGFSDSVAEFVARRSSQQYEAGKSGFAVTAGMESCLRRAQTNNDIGTQSGDENDEKPNQL
jgi:hypothetical protein